MELLRRRKPIPPEGAGGKKAKDDALSDLRRDLEMFNLAGEGLDLIAPGWVTALPGSMWVFDGTEQIVSKLLEGENEPYANPENVAVLKEVRSDLKTLAKGGTPTPAARRVLRERLKMLADMLTVYIAYVESEMQGG